MLLVLIRKTIKEGPFRFTFSRRGLSESVGGRTWRIQSGGDGARYTLRIPGTGLSLRRRIPRKR